MRAFFVLCVCVCGAVSQDLNSLKEMPKYDHRYDYLDIDAILDSKRLVRNYVECLINVKPCTPEGKALKRILPEALRTKCIRCTEKQKKTAVKVIRRLKTEYPTEWAKLGSRWDPTGDFTRYFEDYLAKEQFNTIAGNDLSSSETIRPPADTVPPPIALTRAPPVTRSPEVFVPTTRSTPSPLPSSSTTRMPVDFSTSPLPVILNRFADDGDLMVGSPSSNPQQPMAPSTNKQTEPPPPQTMRPVMPSRPTMIWMVSSSEMMPTRFPLRPNNDMPPPYSTAITFIDQIGYKIIRTTELVTDILRNTVRAVVG